MLDRAYGGQADDFVYGEAGNDQLYGGIGGDWLFGGTGNDRAHGDDGNDNMTGEDGNDTLWGGVGNDNIEGLLLRGPPRDVTLGNDVLYGGDGSDRLLLGSGRDLAYGGSGADRFTTANGYFSTGAARDRIGDFHASQGDLLDLHFVDARTGTAGDQAFAWIGRGSFTGAGQLRFASDAGGLVLQGNVDADLAPELELRLDDLTTFQQAWLLL